MLASLLLKLIVSAFAVSGVLSQSCDRLTFRRCVDGLYGFYTPSGNLQARSIYELDEKCSRTKAAINCVRDYARDCDSSLQTAVIMVNEKEEFVDSYCNDGPTRTEFLRNLRCFSMEDTQLEECIMKFQEKIRNGPPDCCFFYQAMDCSRKVIRDCCPSEAAALHDRSTAYLTRQFERLELCNNSNNTECDEPIPVGTCLSSSASRSTDAVTILSL